MNAPVKNETPKAKKAYRSPTIHYYGSIRTITENIGKLGATDGGGMNPKTG